MDQFGLCPCLDHKPASALVKAQTEEVLKKIDEFLKVAGTDKSRLLSAMVYVSDMRLKPQMDEAWISCLASSNPPVRACVEQGSAWQAHRQLDSRGDDPRCPAGGEEYIYDSGGRNARSTLCRDGNGNSNLPATVRKKSLSSQLQYAM